MKAFDMIFAVAIAAMAAGCTTNEEVVSDPRLAAFSFSDCKNGDGPSESVGFRELSTRMEDMQSILRADYSAADMKLDLHFFNIWLGCNFAPVRVVASVTGNVISVGYSPAYEGGYVDCICSVDIDCTIADLEPGSYVLNVYELREWSVAEPVVPGGAGWRVFSQQVDLGKDISISFPFSQVPAMD